jgi:hypothetical protein
VASSENKQGQEGAMILYAFAPCFEITKDTSSHSAFSLPESKGSNILNCVL